MNNLGLDFHNSFRTGSGQAPRLLHYKGHGGPFVQQTELSVGVLGVPRVSKNTSAQEGTVDITNHGSNIPARELFARPAGSYTPLFDCFTHGLIPHFQIGLVKGVDTGGVRNLYTWPGQHKFANGFVQSKNMNTIAKCHSKEGRRRVEAVSCSHKISSWLKSVCQALGFLLCAFVVNALYVHITGFVVLVNSNYGTSRGSSIYIRGSIQWIKDSHIFSTVFDKNILSTGNIVTNQVDRIVFFFRSKNTETSSKAKSAFQKIVCDNI
mmetsp:Transcript_12453/g.16376  ORF Transcript_12453/g.16376 Transcript_12453/m.16376 type:complete len:266 (+) Transcript_12453:396-1193(+)